MATKLLEDGEFKSIIMDEHPYYELLQEKSTYTNDHGEQDIELIARSTLDSTTWKLKYVRPRGGGVHFYSTAIESVKPITKVTTVWVKD